MAYFENIKKRKGFFLVYKISLFVLSILEVQCDLLTESTKSPQVKIKQVKL